jgi:hypothetical protein
VRKPPEVGPSSSHRRLTLALLCALAACLNPRPEEYPSSAASPGAEASAPAGGTPGAANPTRQGGGDGFEENVVTEDAPSPDTDVPILPPEPPGFADPGVPADAGVDAGVGDAGAPAIAE